MFQAGAFLGWAMGDTRLGGKPTYGLGSGCKDCGGLRYTNEKKDGYAGKKHHDVGDGFGLDVGVQCSERSSM